MGSAASSQGIGALAPRGGKGGGIIPTTNQNIGANPNGIVSSPLFQVLQQQMMQPQTMPAVPSNMPQTVPQMLETAMGPLVSRWPPQPPQTMPRGGKGGGVIPTTNQNIGASPSAFSQTPLGQTLANLNDRHNNRVQ